MSCCLDELRSNQVRGLLKAFAYPSIGPTKRVLLAQVSSPYCISTHLHVTNIFFLFHFFFVFLKIKPTQTLQLIRITQKNIILYLSTRLVKKICDTNINSIFFLLLLVSIILVSISPL